MSGEFDGITLCKRSKIFFAKKASKKKSGYYLGLPAVECEDWNSSETTLSSPHNQ
jgi:hypothetical protein